MAPLRDLLTDLHPAVTHAAALALGRLRRREASAVLTRMLGTAPSVEVIRALAAIATDDDWVRLGQTATRVPELAPVVLAELEDSEDPRAMAVANGIRRRLTGTA
jgi:HEAT repeat protein